MSQYITPKSFNVSPNFIRFEPLTNIEAKKMITSLKVNKSFLYYGFNSPIGSHIKPIEKSFILGASKYFTSKGELHKCLFNAFRRYFSATHEKIDYIFFDSEDSMNQLYENIECPTNWGFRRSSNGYSFEALDLKELKIGPFPKVLTNMDMLYDEPKTYIMIDHNTNLYKIGKSKNPRFREKTLQSEKPTIELIKVFDNANEKDMHLVFSSKRVRGEWFKLSREDFEYIANNYN